MKKVIIGAVVLAAGVAVLRRFGPALGKRAMRKCEEMFEGMRQDSPPKRMMHGLEEIREQNSRILHDIEQERATFVGAAG